MKLLDWQIQELRDNSLTCSCEDCGRIVAVVDELMALRIEVATLRAISYKPGAIK